MAGITLSGGGLLAGSNGGARALLYDAAGNPITLNNKAAFGASQQALPIGGINDATFRVFRSDKYGTQRVGIDTLQFSDDIEGTTKNSQIWTESVTTMTATQSATGLLLNASAITNINTGVVETSQKRFLKMIGMPLKGTFRLRRTLVANQVGEWGFGVPANATTVTIPNGAIWRFNSSGAVLPVLMYNSTEITGADIAGSLNSSNYYIYHVVIDDDKAVFICQDISTGAVISEQTLQTPSTQPKTFSETHLPVFVRVYNTGVAPASAGQIIVGGVFVALMDLMTNKPWNHQMATIGRGVEMVPGTYVQAETFANSAAPSNATLSNTAAGYTTLGGLFSFAAVAGAATDYALFSFAVPIPFSFYLEGLKIATWNTGAAVATTPSLLVWGVGVNGASANLSTGGHLRKAIGSRSLPVAAAIGADVPDLDVTFPTPLRTEGGKHCTVILRMPVGSATASQVIQGLVSLRGYFV